MPENGRICACAAEQRRNMDRFRVVKLSHAAISTATGFCTTGKCIASLLVFINLFIACDVKKALK